MVTTVDAADYEWLSQYRWFAKGTGGKYYAGRAERGEMIMMHREIMKPPPGMVVDHIDGDSLNNRRSNLRICTPRQNNHNRTFKGNTSGFAGVYPQGKRWRAHDHAQRRANHDRHLRRQDRGGQSPRSQGPRNTWRVRMPQLPGGSIKYQRAKSKMTMQNANRQEVDAIRIMRDECPGGSVQPLGLVGRASPHDFGVDERGRSSYVMPSGRMFVPTQYARRMRGWQPQAGAKCRLGAGERGCGLDIERHTCGRPSPSSTSLRLPPQERCGRGFLLSKRARSA